MFDSPTAPRARRWIAAGITVAALVAAPAAAAAPDPATGWHGRAIERPGPSRPAVAGPATWPRGWSAGPVAYGTGSVRPSRRVRAVQRELRARGYAVGPVDGRFGRRTRGSVRWFQVKHALKPSGRVDAVTLAELRTRRAVSAPLVAEPPAPTPVPAAAPGPGNTFSEILLVLALVTTLALLALYWRSRRTPAVVAYEPLPAPPSRSVLGYIVARPGDRERVTVSTAVIAAWCDARDWRLERIIHDSPHHGQHPGERPGLAYVLDRLATGTAAGVVVRHFSDLADTAADLAPMLERVNDAAAFVMAVDEWLDPDVPPGRLTTGALVDLDQHRRRRTFAPGSGVTLREVPELRARVLAMRQRGMSLQTIADTLNASGIPTLRGTSQWRPSTVQVLAGYKPPPTQESLRR